MGLEYDTYIHDLSTSCYDWTSAHCLTCQDQSGCDACSEGSTLNFSTKQNWTDWNTEIHRQNWTTWNIETYQYGYGYSLTNATSKIAAGILILYGVIAIIAILSILVRSCNSDSWSSLGELLILAMNSPPTEVLRNTGAGVGRFKTWKEVVKVRVTEDDKLQLVFEGQENSGKPTFDRKPKAGEKYE